MTAQQQDDYAWVGDVLTQTVPWVKTAELTFVAVSTEHAVVALPDEQSQHNHVGGPHAAMIFGLAETASGAVTLAAFSASLAHATPLVVRADIGYRKLARGPMTAEARLTRPAAEVLAQLEAGSRPEFGVTVDIRNADGQTTAEMTVVWTLRPNR